MKRFRLIVILALVLVMATVGMASAQSPAYQTPFTTSVTYQNVSTSNATIVFSFYPEMNGTAITVNKTLAAGAGSSLYMGSIDTLPTNFTGSAVLSSDAKIVATLVQVPTSDTVKNRPLSNGFASGAADVRIASILKDKFNTTSRFSVQNADSGAVDITVKFYDSANPTAAPIEVSQTNVPVGAAKTYDLGNLASVASGFSGSASISAVKSGTSTPANIVASAMELSTNGAAASAFEGAASSAPTVYMASALCKAFGGVYNSYYAVQNTGAAATTVTVTYSNGKSNAKSIEPGAKASFNACEVANNEGFSGAATITTSPSTNIVVLGKVSGGGVSSAFLGESAGAEQLALPYVRYASDAAYAGGAQRTNIAIQNIGGTVTGVQVQYLNKNGDVVGTETLGEMTTGAKANSKSTNATPASGFTAADLEAFGTPSANPGGGYGGAVKIVGPAGSQLVAVARVSSGLGGGIVGEDYNGIPIQ